LGSENPKLAEQLLEICVFYMLKGDEDLAEEYLRECLTADPINVSGVEGLVHLLRKKGDLEGAEEIARQAVRDAEVNLAPGRTPIGHFRTILGYVLQDREEPEAAEIEYRNALPTYPNARRRLAGLLFTTQNYEAGREILNEFKVERAGRYRGISEVQYNSYQNNISNFHSWNSNLGVSGSKRNAVAAERTLQGDSEIRRDKGYWGTVGLLTKNEDYQTIEKTFQLWKEDLSGSLSMKFAIALANYAIVQQLRGDFVAAEKYWRAHIEETVAILGEDNPIVEPARKYLADMLKAMGKGEKPTREYAECLGRFAPKAHATMAASGVKNLAGFWEGGWSIDHGPQIQYRVDVWRDGENYVVAYWGSDTAPKICDIPVGFDGKFRFESSYFVGKSQLDFKLLSGNTLEILTTNYGPAVFVRGDPGQVRRLAPAELSGSYSGQAGIGDLPMVGIHLDLKCQGNTLSGEVTLPLGKLAIVEGRFLPGNRIFLKVEGSGVAGKMMGIASKGRIYFNYILGFGDGRAMVKKVGD
jgi:tetratricopeptide (TPR) repeat protein